MSKSDRPLSICFIISVQGAAPFPHILTFLTAKHQKTSHSQDRRRPPPFSPSSPSPLPASSPPPFSPSSSSSHHHYHVSNGRLEQALRSVVWMQQESYRPDVVTAAIFVLAWKGDSCFCCQEPVLAYRESFAMRLSITEKPPVW
uniref:Pentatricopeptide repeat-containing protein n=1 Tax=Salix viminalis TaxID=40686 RepID=A0A6N2MDZ9_SALVM